MGNEVNVEFIKAMQIIADRKFGNGDKELKAEEKDAIRFFEEKMEEAFLEEKTINAETFNEAMGLYKSVPAATTETTVEGTTETEETAATEETTKAEEAEEAEETTVEDKVEEKKYEDKHADTRAENLVFRHMEDLTANGTTRNNLMVLLEDKLADLNDDPRYVKLKSSIEDVLKMMPQSYTTLEDIKRQHKVIVEKLESNGTKDKLHLDILDKLEDLAENEVRLAASKTVDNLYAQFAKVKENEPQKTQEQIMDAVKAELENKKQYKAEVEDAFKAYEDKVIMKKAREHVTAAFEQALGLPERKDVVAKAKEILVANGQWDKYTEKAITQSKWYDIITGEERTAKTQAKRQATRNNVELKKHQSKEDVLDKLGKKNEVYDALIASGLITENEDNVDLTLLSDIIGLQVGADNCLNRHAQIDKAISEKFRTTSALAMKTKLESMTESEAKKLAELTGYDIEGKDIRRILIGAIEGFIAGTAIGAAAAAANQHQSVLIEGDQLSHKLNLEIKGDLAADSIGELPAGVTVNETGAGVIITLSQVIKDPDKLIKLPKLVGETAWKTGLMGAALGALKGLEDRGEEPVTVTNFDETDFTKYVERMQWELKRLGRSEELIEGFTCLAASCLREDGSWDKAAYLDELNKLGGDGGKINIKEAPDACPENEEEVKNTVITQGKKDAVAPQKVKLETDDKNYNHSSWEKLADQYECLDSILDDIPDAKTKYPNCYKKRGVLAEKILKAAQAVTDQSVLNDVEKMLYLAEEAFKSPNYKYESLKNCEFIDHTKFCETMKADWLGNVRMPASLAGCNRVEKDTKDNKYDPNAKLTNAPTAPADLHTMTGGEKAKFGYRINGGEVIECKDLLDLNTQVAKAKKEAEDRKEAVSISKITPWDKFIEE